MVGGYVATMTHFVVTHGEWGVAPPPPPLCDTSSCVGFLPGPWTVTRSSLCRMCQLIVVCSAVRPVQVASFVCTGKPEKPKFVPHPGSARAPKTAWAFIQAAAAAFNSVGVASDETEARRTKWSMTGMDLLRWWNAVQRRHCTCGEARCWGSGVRNCHGAASFNHPIAREKQVPDLKNGCTSCVGGFGSESVQQNFYGTSPPPPPVLHRHLIAEALGSPGASGRSKPHTRVLLRIAQQLQEGRHVGLLADVALVHAGGLVRHVVVRGDPPDGRGDQLVGGGVLDAAGGLQVPQHLRERGRRVAGA